MKAQTERKWVQLTKEEYDQFFTDIFPRMVAVLTPKDYPTTALVDGSVDVSFFSVESFGIPGLGTTFNVNKVYVDAQTNEPVGIKTDSGFFVLINWEEVLN